MTTTTTTTTTTTCSPQFSVLFRDGTPISAAAVDATRAADKSRLDTLLRRAAQKLHLFVVGKTAETRHLYYRLTGEITTNKPHSLYYTIYNIRYSAFNKKPIRRNLNTARRGAIDYEPAPIRSSPACFVVSTVICAAEQNNTTVIICIKVYHDENIM